MDPLRPEDGAIMVLASLWIPLMVVLAIFVVDLGNWFEHKRHLQLQADAGALAAARELGVIDPDVGCGASADAAIEQRAKQYAGISGTPTYNRQIGGTPPGEVHFLLNSETYYNQPDRTDQTADFTGLGPCADGMIDVKLTETNLPWYFEIAQVPFINTHARVSILQASTSSGALPVGVPDVDPEYARVDFIDEANNNAVIGSQELIKNGSANGLAIWDNESSPAPVSIPSERVGVRVILSGSESNTQCGQPLVECYDTDAAGRGILRIRGWTSGSAPNAQNVVLEPGAPTGGCSDAYFSAATSDCTFGVRAELDLPFPASDPNLEVNAVITNSNKAAMAYDSTTGTWVSPATLNLVAGAGQVPINITWRKKGSCSGTCSGSFNNVHAAFAGSGARSGPIKFAQVWEDGSFGANSLQRCTDDCHNLVVKIGVEGNRQNARAVSDPVVELRVVGGSLNQSLDCDPALANLKDELAKGCGPQYEINEGTPCPDTTGEPFDCVPAQTGTARNQVAAGMNLRVFGDEQPAACPPNVGDLGRNNWSLFPNIPLGDPRIVQVFLTPFGAFSGSGNTSVPVTNFATFYVTGWTSQGSGFANPCVGHGDDEPSSTDGGYIVGHFISYVDTLNSGGGSEPCDFGSLGTCVAVLTE